MPPGGHRHNVGQGGLARAGRAVQDQGRDSVGLDGAPQQGTRPKQVILADHLLERLRPHPRSQGHLGPAAGLPEQIPWRVYHGISRRSFLDRVAEQKCPAYVVCPPDFRPEKVRGCPPAGFEYSCLGQDFTPPAESGSLLMGVGPKLLDITGNAGHFVYIIPQHPPRSKVVARGPPAPKTNSSSGPARG